MTDKGIINIHGKDYMTVARRVELAHEAKTLESVETEVINHNPVVIKAKVTIKGKVYTGISSIDLSTSRMIEKNNPYEVAETSAVGRALGFAGYGIVESIASADEIVKSDQASKVAEKKAAAEKANGEVLHGIIKYAEPRDKEIDTVMDEANEDTEPCEVHDVAMKARNGANGTFYSHARRLEDGSWDYCSGRGWKSERS
jgi:hypothetical protein